MTAANAAAAANAELGNKAFEWYQGEYERTRGQRDATAARQDQASDALITSMNDANTRSTDLYNYQRDTFRPVEQGIVEDAQNYDTAERRNAEAAQATADVRAATDSQQGALQRSLNRSGVNPNSGRSMVMRNQAALESAKATAGAATTARRRVEMQGYARRMDAANLGRNLPSAQATQAGLGIGAGTAASSTAGQSLATTASGAGLMGQGFNTAIDANSGAGNLYANAARAGAGSDNTGAVVGGIASIAAAFI